MQSPILFLYLPSGHRQVGIQTAALGGHDLYLVQMLAHTFGMQLFGHSSYTSSPGHLGALKKELLLKYVF